MTAWFVISWIAGGVMLLDGMRRSQAMWVHADRDRSWWMTMAVLLGLIGGGLVIGGIYAIGVASRFRNDAATDERFLR